jgi:DNA-binding NarL/FixJ family response regulator
MKIVVAERRVKVRMALRTLLEQDGSAQVVDEAVDAGELLEKVEACCPDLILLDWDLAHKRSQDMIAELRRLCPGVGIVALSGEPSACAQALAAGADAFVNKGDPPERLIEALSADGRGSKAPEEG